MRTREAVLDALTDLLREGEVAPTAQLVADRAGISLRSIYAHFATRDELFLAMADRATAVVVAMVSPIDASAPLAERIEGVAVQRSEVNEALGPVRRAADLLVATSPPLAAQRKVSRAASRQQIERVFAAELSALDEPARRRLVAGIDATLAGAYWDRLRLVNDLALDEAAAVVRQALAGLLGGSDKD